MPKNIENHVTNSANPYRKVKIYTILTKYVYIYPH